MRVLEAFLGRGDISKPSATGSTTYDSLSIPIEASVFSVFKNLEQKATVFYNVSFSSNPCSIVTLFAYNSDHKCHA